MKFIPILFSTPMVQAIIDGRKTQTRRVVKDKAGDVKCPYGKEGDVLWVRETWAELPNPDCFGKYLYKSMGDTAEKWKPSIFMPKEACRIFLRVKSVRVERLQDISEDDAKEEGVESWINERLASKPVLYKNYEGDSAAWYCSKAVTSFETLWQSINGVDSWEANPYVWVIEFERIEKPNNF
jgi:hypothetical protein